MPGSKIVADLKSDEILPLLLCKEVVEVTESGQSVKAVSVGDEEPILMKSENFFLWDDKWSSP